MKHLTLTSLAALGLWAASLGGAAAVPVGGPFSAAVAPGAALTVPVQYYGGRRYYAPGRSYRRGYYGGGGGAAVGVLGGLAAGAIIGGAIASSQAQAAPPPPATVDPQLADYCARRYRTFDYDSGTFLARSGERIVCTYP